MPFTASHPAAVVPLLLSRRSRRWLTPSALVVGSMVPDIWMFAPAVVVPRTGTGVSWLYHRTHDWSGLVTIDVALGIAVLLLWHGAVGPALLAALPASVRRRLRWPGPAPLGQILGSWSALLRTVTSVVIGATSHAVWDAFTHNGRWGVRLVPQLQEWYAGRQGDWWLQMASTAVGAVVILAALALAWAGRWPGSAPEVDRRPAGWLAVRPLPLPVSLAGLFLVAGASMAAVPIVAVRSAGSGPEIVVVQMLTNTAGVAAAVIVALALGWRLAAGPAVYDHRSGRAQRPPS